MSRTWEQCADAAAATRARPRHCALALPPQVATLTVNTWSLPAPDVILLRALLALSPYDGFCSASDFLWKLRTPHKTIIY